MEQDKKQRQSEWIELERILFWNMPILNPSRKKLLFDIKPNCIFECVIWSRLAEKKTDQLVCFDNDA